MKLELISSDDARREVRVRRSWGSRTHAHVRPRPRGGGADARVNARVNAVSGIVSIPTPNQTIMGPSGASAQVTVPMISVANGKTSLRATLTTTSGIVISDPVFIEIEVQAEWESITLVAFIAIVASIMGIGIARTIRDRRRRS